MAWQEDRARRLGLPVGFATQMPLRLASTCLPAARDRVLGGRSQSVVLSDLEDEEELGVDPDDVDEAERRLLGEEDDVPSSGVVAAARRLGDVDTQVRPVPRDPDTDRRGGPPGAVVQLLAADAGLPASGACRRRCESR